MEPVVFTIAVLVVVGLFSLAVAIQRNPSLFSDILAGLRQD